MKTRSRAQDQCIDALRVGIFQQDRLLDERILRRRKVVTIGRDYRRNTFCVPASELPESIRLFEVSGGSYVLVIRQGMTGRLKVDGGVKTLQDLVESGRAVRSGDIARVTLGRGAQGRITYRGATILFQFVHTPPAPPRPVLPAHMRGGWFAGADRILLGSTSAVAALLVGFVVYLQAQQWPVDQEAHELIQDRFVSKTLSIELEPREPPELEPVPEQIERGAEEADAGVASAEPDPKPEPTRREPPAPSEDRASEADAMARADGDRRRRLARQVAEATIISELGALSAEGGEGGLVNLLEDGAGRTSIDVAFEGSRRVIVGAVGEKGGLKSSGGDDVGAAVAPVGAPDMSKSSGARAAEEAVADTPTKSQKKVTARVNLAKSKPRVVGKLDPDSVARALKKSSRSLQRCYERELKNTPSARGKIVIMFTIGTAGRVTDARVTVDSVGGGVGSCVEQAIRRLRFPKPSRGPATVSKAMIFSKN